ncbi:MAG: YihY family inner membrane protein [Gammaproteobacteria bacterium]|nr:YihY family inner membrane protein [Gammaproteobacteria bacterium]
MATLRVPSSWLKVVNRTHRFFAAVGRRFLADRCLRSASALSFTTVLSLVPLVAVVFGSMSMFPVFGKWGEALQGFIYRNFVPAAGDVIFSHLERFAGTAGQLTTIGLVALVLSALLLLVTIEEAFNDVWRVHKGRSLVQRVLAYWTVLTLGPLLMGASLSLTSYLLSLSLIPDQAMLVKAHSIFLRLLPFVFEVLAFTLLYLVVPNCSVRPRDAFWGGVVAALLFEITKRGFALFVLNYSNYQIIYGALAAIPIFLIWIYLSWLVILIGAEFAVTASGRTPLDQTAEPTPSG